LKPAELREREDRHLQHFRGSSAAASLKRLLCSVSAPGGAFPRLFGRGLIEAFIDKVFAVMAL